MNTKIKSVNKARPVVRRSAQRNVSTTIASFAREFMLKPGEHGFDAVGELIKARRGA